jgi:hypothetical protein
MKTILCIGLSLTLFAASTDLKEVLKFSFLIEHFGDHTHHDHDHGHHHELSFSEYLHEHYSDHHDHSSDPEHESSLPYKASLNTYISVGILQAATVELQLPAFEIPCISHSFKPKQQAQQGYSAKVWQPPKQSVLS